MAVNYPAEQADGVIGMGEGMKVFGVGVWN
jgi:hypothetical protein